MKKSSKTKRVIAKLFKRKKKKKEVVKRAKKVVAFRKKRLKKKSSDAKKSAKKKKVFLKLMKQKRKKVFAERKKNLLEKRKRIKAVLTPEEKGGKIKTGIISKLFQRKEKKQIEIPKPIYIPKGKIKSILIAQPQPETEKHPYSDLPAKFKVKIVFKPFVHLEPLSAKEFRHWHIYPNEYTSIIFTSRSTVDNFYKLMNEMRVRISEETKYFCLNESIALYLQKYVLFKKRKMFYGDGSLSSLFNEIYSRKERKEKYLLPCADNHKQDIAQWLKRQRFNFAEAIIFKSVSVLLNEEEDLQHDMISFFTPTAVQSFAQNFPTFVQKNIRVAVFGEQTKTEAEKINLRVDVFAPTLETPSMGMAMEKYLAANS